MGDHADRDHGDEVPSTLRLNHVFEALANPRRRYLLYTLLRGDELSLEEIARSVTAWEKDVPVETVTDEEAERTYVALYHSHIPKLVEADIVEFERTTETIRRANNAEQVLNVLANAGGSGDAGQEAHARRDSDDGHA